MSDVLPRVGVSPQVTGSCRTGTRAAPYVAGRLIGRQPGRPARPRGPDCQTPLAGFCPCYSPRDGLEVTRA
ncbi:hypothetical protein GCM10009566_43210 [Streptomyces murinus]